MRLLFEEKPYASTLAPDKWHANLCFGCFANTKLRRCSGCRIAGYCDKKCQKKDWKRGQHKIECKALCDPEKLRRIEENEHSEIVVLLAKLFSRSQQDGGESSENDLQHFPSKTNFRKLEDLLSHEDKMEDFTVEAHWNLFSATFGEILKLWVSKAQFRRMLGVADTNSYSIFRNHIYEGQQKLGTGLYLQSSRFDHKCDPQIDRLFEGCTLKLLTSGANKLNLKNLHVCYFKAMLDSTSERRRQLSSWHFTCECELCTDATFDKHKLYCINISCQRCAKPMVLLPGDTTALCLSCQSSQILPHQFPQKTTFIRNQLEKARNSNVSFPEDSLTEYAELLHPVQNILLLNARLDALEFALRKERLDSSVRLAEAVLLSYDCYNYRLIRPATICANVARTLNLNGRKQDTLLWYEKARTRWKSLFGEKYHCVTELSNIIRSIKSQK